MFWHRFPTFFSSSQIELNFIDPNRKENVHFAHYNDFHHKQFDTSKVSPMSNRAVTKQKLLNLLKNAIKMHKYSKLIEIVLISKKNVSQ